MQASRNIRNETNKLNSSLKRKYFSKQIDKAEGDIEATWKTVNKLLNKKSKTTEIPHLDVDGEIITDTSKKAEELNKYFANIGKTLNSNFEKPVNDKKPESYLPKVNSIFKFKYVTGENVVKAISRLKNKRTYGLDKISSFILKIAAPVISSSLAKIFNISLKTGVFPVQWKYARLAPIFKGDLKSETENYRPISVLSTLARVFERLIYNQLSNYFESNGYLTKCQYGFRKFHSTVTAILKNSNDWLLNMDNGSINGMVLFDLKKAFDTIDHEILLSKLASYGILESEHKWFKSYLTSRKHCCILEGERSFIEEVTCGIPQGSCLGPLLFLIYINQLYPTCT